MNRCDVLIVGAGPTGLVLALWLTKLGVKIRIIDKTVAPGTASRALAVQARTLELYRQLDLTDEVVRRGHRTPAVNLWVKGKKAARFRFDTAGLNATPYPFPLIFPQDEHEQLLIERLRSFGVCVERRTALAGFDAKENHITAQLNRDDGEGNTNQEICEATYIAGCDGARGLVRETIGAGFPGGTYRQVFYVADVEASGPAIDGELHVDLDEADFLAAFPLAGSGRARLIGTVRDARADRSDTLNFADVSDRAINNMKVSVQRVNWFSTYHVHHRVSDRFRSGRAFLLGDAAHIHSPAGGQGMNTGIGDAINLAWKLAAVIGGHAPDRLLDSYEAERIGFARRLVATTDRVFSFATSEGKTANFLRTRLAPLLLPRIFGIARAREYLFRTVGQLNLNYRGGPLSLGTAGRVHGGDRLPWVSIDGRDNFASLTAMVWQVHVYGAPGQGLVRWCEGHGVALRVFEWQADHLKAGLRRDGLYLLRPDGYVALADASGSPDALERYCNERQISVGGASSNQSGSAGITVEGGSVPPASQLPYGQ